MSDAVHDRLFSLDEQFHLDMTSPVPLYHQMEQILLDRIQNREALDKLLPPEKDLMVIFGVSRATVKKTLDNLADKGLVERRRALGTRVISQEITEDLGKLKSYTEEMRTRSLDVKGVVLDVRVAEPDRYIRDHMNLAKGEQTLILRRLRGTSRVFPVVFLSSYIPASFKIKPDEDFNGSLYNLLENKYRIPIEWAQEEISASRASEEEARHLGLRTGDTVLVMERTTCTRQNKVLEFVRGVYQPDHYKFSIRLKR